MKHLILPLIVATALSIIALYTVAANATPLHHLTIQVLP